MPRLRSLEVRLHINDFERSVAFYRDVLAFTVETTFPAEKPVFAILIRDNVAIQIGGIDTHKAAEAPSTCTLYLDVQDALGLHRAVKDKVTVEWGPEVYFYHRREFAFRDPDGHLIIVSEETNDPVTARED